MPHAASTTEAKNGHNANNYDQNARFWVQIIRGNRDRYRTELTNSALLDSLGPVNGMRVLDAGCGEGYLTRQLASSGASALDCSDGQALGSEKILRADLVIPHPGATVAEVRAQLEREAFEC